MGDEFENGFQVRDVKIQQLIVTDVNPTLEEVTRFASGADDGTENLDLKALAASLKDSNTTVTYLPGDIVEVYAGEQKGMVGKATNVQGDIVTMTVTEGDLEGENMEVPIKALRKRFKIGDHVKVIGGSRFQDEVGTVVKISEDRVTMLTDHTNNEVTVFSKDLREASDIGGQGSIGQFSLHDLIQLDQTTVACVVKVDRDSMVVLDQFGDTRQVMPSQIPNKIPKRKQAVAADREGSEIRLDDVVKEFGGQQRQGKIIHIHRSYVFLHTNESTENAGVFVTKAGLVNTVAAKGGRVTAAASGPDLNSMNPALKIHKNGAENKNAAPVKMIGRDRAINQTVIIKKGAYKGLLGIVKDTTDTHARVELHTKSKTITVPRESLNFKDKATGASIDINGRGRGGGFGQRGGSDRVPSWQGGSRTPMGGSGSSDRVPAWGSRSKYCRRRRLSHANLFSKHPPFLVDELPHGRAPIIQDLARRLGQTVRVLSTRTTAAALPTDRDRARLPGNLVQGHPHLATPLARAHARRRMERTAGRQDPRHQPGEPPRLHQVPAATTRGATHPAPMLEHTTRPRQAVPWERLRQEHSEHRHLVPTLHLRRQPALLLPVLAGKAAGAPTLRRHQLLGPRRLQQPASQGDTTVRRRRQRLRRRQRPADRDIPMMISGGEWHWCCDYSWRFFYQGCAFSLFYFYVV